MCALQVLPRSHAHEVAFSLKGFGQGFWILHHVRVCRSTCTVKTNMKVWLTCQRVSDGLNGSAEVHTTRDHPGNYWLGADNNGGNLDVIKQHSALEVIQAQESLCTTRNYSCTRLGSLVITTRWGVRPHVHFRFNDRSHGN